MARILLVDDDQRIRSVLNRTLTEAGHTVIEASDGKLALKALRQFSVMDLVITDLFMPEKDGFETILELGRDYSHLSIIAISGHLRINIDSFLLTAMHLGAKKTLKKPFSKQDLIDAVDQVLRVF
ncbi:MAG: response regulator [Candidatus Riflebacteria bacterium]|nr:response regulator [Candidatus Riflebacteria bacterium]